MIQSKILSKLFVRFKRKLTYENLTCLPGQVLAKFRFVLQSNYITQGNYVLSLLQFEELLDPMKKTYFEILVIRKTCKILYENISFS